MKSVSFIILAAGKGVRMKSPVPKPLQEIGNKSMLERVVESSRNINPEKLVVVVSDEKVALKAENLGAEVAWQKIPVGTADAFKKALVKCADEGDIILSCSDIPLITEEIFKSLYKKHIEENNYITILTARMPNPEGYGRVIKEKNRVVKIVEEKEASEEEKAVELVNSGVYCFSRKNLEKYLERIDKSAVKGEYYLTDLVEIVISEGLKVGEIDCDYRLVKGINTMEQLRDAEALWSEICTIN